MGRLRWTTEEQRTWLEVLIPEFLELQCTKVVGKFLKTTYLEWEKSCPTIPTQEKLECAKGMQRQGSRKSPWCYVTQGPFETRLLTLSMLYPPMHFLRT